MVAACRQDMKQTNHCKLTMVWFEDDNSFRFVLLQSDHVTAGGITCRCSVFHSRLFSGEAIFVRRRDHVMVSGSH